MTLSRPPKSAPSTLRNGLTRSSSFRLLTAIFLCGLLLRLFIVLLVFRDIAGPSLNHEQFGWEMGWIARSLALGHGFSSPFFIPTGPTALVPPLYPYILSLVFHAFGVYSAPSAFAILSFNSLCSALTCVPLYFLTKRAANARIALLAALAWTLHPFAIYFSTNRVWDYALTCLLLTTCLAMAQGLHLHRRLPLWLFFGALFGLATLSNPAVSTLFVALLLLALSRVDTQIRPMRCVIACIGFLAVIAPWTVRNYRTLHMIVPIRDNFWLEFRAGNNGNAFESNDHTARPPSSAKELQTFMDVGERAYLASSHTQATRYIRNHPAVFVRSILHRVVFYWTGYWSFAPEYLREEPTAIPLVMFCIALTLLMLRGIRHLWLSRRMESLPLLLTVVIFPCSYYLTHVKPDFRQAIEPVITIFVTIGIAGLADSAQKRSGRSMRQVAAAAAEPSFAYALERER